MLNDFMALSQLATRLTGKKWVNVELQRPPWPGFFGAAIATPGGEFTIYLDPKLPQAEQYKIFLHECAHVNLHGGRMVPITPQELQAGAPDSRPGTKTDGAHVAQLEREADILADIWDGIARNGAGSFATVDALLRALYQN